MPQKRSAKKELRKSIKRHRRNLQVKQQIKDSVKKLKKSVEGADTSLRQDALKNIFKTLDKAVSKGMIHPNKAARKKSRFTRLLNKSVSKTNSTQQS